MIMMMMYVRACAKTELVGNCNPNTISTTYRSPKYCSQWKEDDTPRVSFFYHKRLLGDGGTKAAAIESN